MNRYVALIVAIAAGCGDSAKTKSMEPRGDANAAGAGSTSPTTGKACEGTVIAPPPFAWADEDHPYQLCDGVAATGEAPVISDFEQCTVSVLDNEGRNGDWFSYDDGTAGTITMEVTSDVLHVSSADWSAFGAGVGLHLGPALNSAENNTEHCVYDASIYAGIRFRARGSGEFRTMAVSFANYPVVEGGGCDRPGDDCYNWPGKAVALSDEWKTVELPFSELRPEIGWGGDVAPLDPTEIVAIEFRLPAGPDIDLWMDDLEFFTAEQAEGSVSGCPMDLAPYPENIAPNRSGLALTEELTLHTFEQETPRCGSITRRYLSFVPADLPPAESDAPVIIALHGSGASAESFQSLYARGRLDALAARDGFVVVYGNAAPGEYGDIPNVLNSGAWRQDIFDDGEVDDIAYLERVVEDLRERSVISGDNDVYLIGLSNGGGMAIKAATERPELFRGIAPFMAFAGFSPPPPPDLTGTGLTHIFFAYSLTDPGLFEEYLDIQADVPLAWAEALGLPAEVIEAPAETPIPNTVFEGEDYEGDAVAARNTRDSAATQLDMVAPDGLGKVRILVFDHAGHLWPSPVGDTEDSIVGSLGFRNQDLDAADAIWEFFGETDSE